MSLTEDMPILKSAMKKLFGLILRFYKMSKYYVAILQRR